MWTSEKLLHSQKLHVYETEAHGFVVASARWLFCHICIQRCTQHQSLFLVVLVCLIWSTTMSEIGALQWYCKLVGLDLVSVMTLMWPVNLKILPGISRWCFVFFYCIDDNLLCVRKLTTTVECWAYTSPLDLRANWIFED